MFKKTWELLKYALLGFLGVLTLYFILASLLLQIKFNKDFTETPAGIPIYICSNGVHTDIAFPVRTSYID